MNDHYTSEKFVSMFDASADHVFAYCWERTADREIAQYLTRMIFSKTWDKILESNRKVTSLAMKSYLYTTFQETMDAFAPKADRFHFSEKLWNMSLAQ